MPYRVTSPTVRPHLSFSQLVLAADCGEAYRRAYVEGEEDSSWNVPALCGSAFHAAVEEIESTRSLPYSTDLSAQLTKATRSQVNTLLDDLGLTSDDLIYYGKQDLPYWMRNKLSKLAKAYIEQRGYEVEHGIDFLYDPREAVGMSIEVEVSAVIGEHPFLGMIDAVMADSLGRVFIRDLKTGKAKPGHALQLEYYRLLFERATGIDVDYGQILYVNNSTAHPQVVRWQLDDQALDEMAWRTMSLVGYGLFPVNGPFNGACANCPFRGDCAYGNAHAHGSS